MPGSPPSPAEPNLPPSAWLDAVAQPLVLTDAAGRVLHANAALAALLGTEAAALAGQASDPWFQPGADAGADTGRGLLRTADGRDLPVDWVVRPLPAPGGPLRLTTLTDQSATLALRDQLAHVGSVLELMQDFGRIGLWERDLLNGQGRWDRHMYRFWGLPPGDGAPDFTRAFDAVVPDDQPALRAATERSLAQPGRHEVRYRVRGADGVVRTLHSQWQVTADAQGRPARSVGVVSDDTEADQRARRADEATAQLKLAADLADVAIWRHDLRANVFHYSDKAWAVLDLPPRAEPLTLQEVRALIHPDDLAHVAASAELALRSEGPVDMRARYRSRKRGWRDVLTRRVVQRDADGKPVAFLGVALDVTEQVERQQRERDLGHRLELAAAAGGIGLFSLDPATGEHHWNAQMRQLHGLADGPPPRELEDYARRFVPVEHHATFLSAMRSLGQRAGGQVDLDLPILRTDGQLRRMSVHVRVQHASGGPQYIGVMLDVTERRAAEQALRQAHERLTLATRGAGLGTWEQDLQTGKGWWDEQMWRLRGLPPGGDVAPEHAERIALVHPDDRASVEREHEQANRERRAARVEFRIRTPDGRLRWIASRSVPIFDDAGRMTRRIGVNWDITDAREAEAARQAELSAQRESQAKSQFLARMSHELRTPLNAVIGFTQLLQAEDLRVDAQTRRRQLDHIRTAGEHLLSLIDDVLDLSSLESGELRLDPAEVDLPPMVQATLPLVHELAERRGVSLRCGALAGTARADATRLRQVLINLLTNAVKYNRSGGEVEVAAETAGDWVLLRVSDTGVGLTRDQLRHLFEPFNRLGAERSEVQGTGIGLAIVKATVERMGGSVRVQSRPATGTRVEVRLPRGDLPASWPGPAGGHAAPAGPHTEPGTDAPTAPTTAPTTDPPTDPPTQVPTVSPHAAARVLYIEDNPVNAMIVREIMARRPGITLQSAESGLQGVALAQAEPPRLVLVDMQLPDIDGHEVLRRLRADERTRGVPCIALSANAMPEDIQRALAAGFTDYWTKPLDVRGFLAALDRLLA